MMNKKLQDKIKALQLKLKAKNENNNNFLVNYFDLRPMMIHFQKMQILNMMLLKLWMIKRQRVLVMKYS